MGTIQVLIIEDEVIVALDLADRLEGMGYSVVGTAAFGAEALRVLQPGRILRSAATAVRPDAGGEVLQAVEHGPVSRGGERARDLHADRCGRQCVGGVEVV